MKYTREQLEQMSDFEINAALCEKLGLTVMHDSDPLHDDDAAVYNNGYSDEDYNGTNINYCNNWNDIMPLAVEHNITYVKNEGAAFADLSDMYLGFDYSCIYNDEKPQRAIACCLLMMELRK